MKKDNESLYNSVLELLFSTRAVPLNKCLVFIQD